MRSCKKVGKNVHFWTLGKFSHGTFHSALKTLRRWAPTINNQLQTPINCPSKSLISRFPNIFSTDTASVAIVVSAMSSCLKLKT